MKRLMRIILLLFTSLSLNAHDHPRSYSFEGYVSDNSSWMSSVALKDDTPLSMITLPGTHDTMSYGDYISLIARNQGLTLNEQLKTGIRALDIRMRATDDGLPIHHGRVYLKANFTDVMNSVVSFLKSNPTEFILMRVKQEKCEEGESECSNDGIVDKFKSTIDNDNFKPFIWMFNGSNNPTYKDIMGKIVLLRDDGLTTSKLDNYGLNYKNFNADYKQDEYKIGYSKTISEGIYDKWKVVKSQLAKMSQHSSTPPIGINFLSASGGVVAPNPFQVASGHSDSRTAAPRLSTGNTNATPDLFPDFPRLDCIGAWCSIYTEGINTLSYNIVGDDGYDRHLGIVYMDFPGYGLIEKLINTNRPLTSFGYDESPRALLDLDNNGLIDYVRVVGTYHPENFSISLNNYNGIGHQYADYFYMDTIDLGFNDLPQEFPDINGDGFADFCRAVGRRERPQMLCSLGGVNGFTEGDLRMVDFDWGYSDMRAFADVNGDGKDDYCRVVNNVNDKRFSCTLSTDTGVNGQTFRTSSTIDFGYSHLPRLMADVNGDGKDDFCRAVGGINGGGPRMMCSLMGEEGLTKQALYTSSFDFGYSSDIQQFADVDGNGKDDYCRIVGNPGDLKMLCSLSTDDGINTVQKYGTTRGTGYDELHKKMIDVNADGRADFCRAVGTYKGEYFLCSYAEKDGTIGDKSIRFYP